MVLGDLPAHAATQVQCYTKPVSRAEPCHAGFEELNTATTEKEESYSQHWKKFVLEKVKAAKTSWLTHLLQAQIGPVTIWGLVTTHFPRVKSFRLHYLAQESGNFISLVLQKW